MHTCLWCDNGVRMAVPELILRSWACVLVACERCISYVHFVVSSCSSLVLLPCAQLFICLEAFMFLFSTVRAFELLDASNAELRTELVSALCAYEVYRWVSDYYWVSPLPTHPRISLGLLWHVQRMRLYCTHVSAYVYVALSTVYKSVLVLIEWCVIACTHWGRCSQQ